MDHWQELINLFAVEDQEAVEELVILVRDQHGIQDFEEFAALPDEVLAEMVATLPPDHPYNAITDPLELLGLAASILARAYHIMQRQHREVQPWQDLVATYPAEEQNALWHLFRTVQEQFGIEEFQEFAELPPDAVLEFIYNLPEYNALQRLEPPDARLALAEEILAHAQRLLGGVVVASQDTVYEFAGQLVDEETESPLPNLTVQGYDLEADPDPLSLGEDLTDERGLFVLYYSIPADLVPGFEARNLRLEVLDAEDQVLHESEELAPADQPEPQIIHIAGALRTEGPVLEVRELNNTLNLGLSTNVINELESRDIHTLSDIRVAGGLAGLSLPQDVVATLEGHSSLSLLSESTKVNSALLARGYSDVTTIAGTPQTEFLTAVGSDIGLDEALRLHTVAGLQELTLDNLMADALASRASGLAMMPTLDKLPPPRCTCKDCESAVSPGAYLADLLRYATQNIRSQTGAQDTSQAVDLADLARWFHQPFADMPATCEAATEKVRLIRICVEVLQSYLKAQSHQAPDVAWQEYRWTAYKALLTQLGTSYDELRFIRSTQGDDSPEAQETRQRLAQRLGVPLKSAGIDSILERLLLDRASITDRLLKGLFGLPEPDFVLSPAKESQRSTLLNLRLEHLRDQWEEQDWPDSGWNAGWPLVDPDLISRDDIRPTISPQPGKWAANPALALWDNRRTWLDKVEKQIQDTRAGLQPATGANHVHNALQMQVFGNNASELARFLEKRAGLEQGAAPQNLDDDLLAEFQVRLEEFQKLLDLLDKEREDTAGVSEEEWQEACNIMVQILKRREVIRDGGWLSQEANSNLALSPRHFWIAAVEPQDENWPPAWRGDQETRAAWKAAVHAERRRPGFEPDIVGQADFKDPYSGGRAYDLWQEHRQDLAAIRSGLGAPETIAAGVAVVSDLDGLLHKGLGVNADTLEKLVKARRSGDKVDGQLSQLCLGPGAAEFLVRMRALSSPLEEEWDQVFDILTQVVKERDYYARWRQKEQAKRLTTSPDHLTLPPPEAFPGLAPSHPSPWRAPAAARRAWKEKLQARIDQKETTRQALFDAIGAAEQAALPLLRDALVDASGAPGVTREEKARWLAERLLIDVQTSACRETTRVSQAIETLQGLIPSVLSGRLQRFYEELLRDSTGELLLETDHFDEEWRWLGSYATWRAAMFVFMFPENLLLPTLRRHQTPAFQRLVDAMRQSPRLSLDLTCQLAQDYADYARDIATLSLEATCQTLALIREDSPCSRSSTWLRRCFLFARGSSGVIYWSTHTLTGGILDKGYEQSFWEVVPNLPSDARVVGAVSYHTEGDRNQKHIYLLYLTWEANAYRLYYTRYDLRTGEWESQYEDPVMLPLPPNPMQILVRQTYSEWAPPRIGITLRGVEMSSDTPSGPVWNYVDELHGYYERALNGQGSGWRQAPDEPLPEGGEGLRTTKEERKARHKERQGWNLIHFAHQMQALASVDSLAVGEALIYYSEDEWISNQGSFRCFFGLEPPPRTYGARDQAPVLVKDVQDRPSSYYHGCVLGYGGYVDVYLGSKAHRIDSRGSISQSFNARPAQARRVPAWGEADDETGWRMLAYQIGSGAKRGIYSVLSMRPEDGVPQFTTPARLAPDLYERAIVIRPHLASDKHWSPKSDGGKVAINANLEAAPAHKTYIEEAFYHVPLQIARELQGRGQYVEAMAWFRSIYDFARAQGEDRYVYYGLRMAYQAWKKQSSTAGYWRQEEWLSDPLNPHAVARKRPLAGIRYTLNTIIRCLVAYADAEFTRDTPESVARARGLYLNALELLQAEELDVETGPCQQLLHRLKLPEDAGPEATAMFGMLRDELAVVSDSTMMSGLVSDVENNIRAGNFGEAVRLVRAARSDVQAGMNQGQTMFAEGETRKEMHADLTAYPGAARGLAGVARVAGAEASSGTLEGTIYHPRVPLHFCLPPNPVPLAQRLRTELNLLKIRTCRNIAGMERPMEPYAAPTDTTSGMPALGAGGRISVPAQSTPAPVPYRYDYLIERARQLADRAAQMEAAYVTAMQRAEEETYNVLKARQDLQLSRAGVRLQDLRVKEAKDSVTLAELQQQRAQIQADTYTAWIEAGLNEYEQEMIGAYKAAADARREIAMLDAFARTAQAMTTAATGSFAIAAALASAAIVGVTSVLSVSAKGRALAAETRSKVAGLHANHERRKQEWQLQKLLAEQDGQIGEQQIQIASDRVDVVGQERAIASLQSDFSEAVVEFLDIKFFRAELYAWMSDVLGGVYGYFLQQATSVARLAETQLAFERQEAAAGIIEADYWTAPQQEGSRSPGVEASDRRGLTGSARLLADIHKLDQHRFETEKRKLQLGRTFSLASLAPAEFQAFRATGVMQFGTSMELFDRDFPGHYLRLIKRVRTSVIALIPPTEGIRASLSTSGLSRVVTANQGVFQTQVVRRPPESVALTSPVNASGLFEMTPQQGSLAGAQQGLMLLPFESMGVDATWEFRMPKASNPFDYGTIADILLSIEYTALDSFDYRQQVVQRLGRDISGDRAFSFRHEFADQWYDLHNPEQTATPMTVRFRTESDDFAPNVDGPRIKHVLLCFAGTSGVSFDIQVSHLRFTPQGSGRAMGGGAATTDGIASTRRGSAAAWTAMIGQPVTGEWELALPNTAETKERFSKEKVEDILLVITYAGQTPEWPV